VPYGRNVLAHLQIIPRVAVSNILEPNMLYLVLYTVYSESIVTTQIGKASVTPDSPAMLLRARARHQLYFPPLIILFPAAATGVMMCHENDTRAGSDPLTTTTTSYHRTSVRVLKMCSVTKFVKQAKLIW
jgi:hypothetical protein